MFSICIWDKKLKKFYSFRDRFGIKPLYYTSFRGIYIFSSEIKDIILLLKKKKFLMKIRVLLIGIYLTLF